MADGGRPDDVTFDEAVDAAAAKLSRGESVGSVLRPYPQHADSMRGLLDALKRVLAIPLAHPSRESRASAARAMFAELDEPRAARTSVFGAFPATLGARHLRFQAAAASLALLLFGGIGFASAAGDRSPIRVPGFFLVPSRSSGSTIEIRGSIVALGAHAITLRTSGGDRTATMDQTTQIRIGDAPGTAADLVVGQTATVSAFHNASGALRARRVVVAPPVPTPSPADLAPAIDISTPSSRQDDRRRGDEARTPEPTEDSEHDAAPRSENNDSHDGGEHTDTSAGATPDGDREQEEFRKTPVPDDRASPTSHDGEDEHTAAPGPAEQPGNTDGSEPNQRHD